MLCAISGMVRPGKMDLDHCGQAPRVRPTMKTFFAGSEDLRTVGAIEFRGQELGSLEIPTNALAVVVSVDHLHEGQVVFSIGLKVETV